MGPSANHYSPGVMLPENVNCLDAPPNRTSGWGVATQFEMVSDSFWGGRLFSQNFEILLSLAGSNDLLWIERPEGRIQQEFRIVSL